MAYRYVRRSKSKNQKSVADSLQFKKDAGSGKSFVQRKPPPEDEEKEITTSRKYKGGKIGVTKRGKTTIYWDQWKGKGVGEKGKEVDVKWYRERVESPGRKSEKLIHEKGNIRNEFEKLKVENGSWKKSNKQVITNPDGSKKINIKIDYKDMKVTKDGKGPFPFTKGTTTVTPDGLTTLKWRDYDPEGNPLGEEKVDKYVDKRILELSKPKKRGKRRRKRKIMKMPIPGTQALLQKMGNGQLDAKPFSP